MTKQKQQVVYLDNIKYEPTSSPAVYVPLGAVCLKCSVCGKEHRVPCYGNVYVPTGIKCAGCIE